MCSKDVINAVNVAPVAGISRSRYVCHEGSGEISEKAGALVPIQSMWQIDTEYCKGRLPRDSGTWSERFRMHLGILTVYRLSLARWLKPRLSIREDDIASPRRIETMDCILLASTQTAMRAEAYRHPRLSGTTFIRVPHFGTPIATSIRKKTFELIQSRSIFHLLNAPLIHIAISSTYPLSPTSFPGCEYPGNLDHFMHRIARYLPLREQSATQV